MGKACWIFSGFKLSNRQGDVKEKKKNVRLVPIIDGRPEDEKKSNNRIVNRGSSYCKLDS